jgi:signal recognition particle receptor subunit beta
LTINAATDALSEALGGELRIPTVIAKNSSAHFSAEPQQVIDSALFLAENRVEVIGFFARGQINSDRLVKTLEIAV